MKLMIYKENINFTKKKTSTLKHVSIILTELLEVGDKNFDIFGVPHLSNVPYKWIDGVRNILYKIYQNITGTPKTYPFYKPFDKNKLNRYNRIIKMEILRRNGVRFDRK